MRNGLQRHRLAIRAATEAADEYNQMIKTWATSSTVWGSVRPMAGEELVNAQQVHALTTHKITIRYISTLTTEMRILFRTRIFEIVAIMDYLERQEKMVLLCKEIA